MTDQDTHGPFEDPLSIYDPPEYADPLEQALAEETVAAIHSQPFVAVAPDTPIARALQALAGLDIGCLLVAEDNKLLGMFTVRDVLDKVVEQYDALKDQPVSNVMTPDPVTVYEADPTASALCAMAAGGYRHVPVLDMDERLVGVVSPQRVAAFLRDRLLIG